MYRNRYVRGVPTYRAVVYEYTGGGRGSTDIRGASAMHTGISWRSRACRSMAGRRAMMVVVRRYCRCFEMLGFVW